MNTALLGILGTLAGVSLGFVLPTIKELLSKKEKLYVDASNKLGFVDTQNPDFIDNLTGILDLYIFNGSNIPKTFLIDRVIEVNGSRSLRIERINDEVVKTKPVHLILPNSAINLKILISVIDYDGEKPTDMNNNKARVKYRVGKKIRSLDIDTFVWILPSYL
ncbi:hypothetical protein [Chitinophaga sp. Cy-1792]|uniref:hypothetical protein n=1 Tax=Chitinophaga sp. Cy-1792 TaxID=2608339 RepID=UPI00141FBFEE|nr:hypothetical protein [Chitinophaga sp. Cy-1792]NIG52503.1 hypothetical protein [Chitinophaga sp. Cy-1792]